VDQIKAILFSALLLSSINVSASPKDEFAPYIENIEKIRKEKLENNKSSDNKCILSQSLSKSIEQDKFRLPKLDNISNRDRFELNNFTPALLRSFWDLRLNLRDQFTSLQLNGLKPDSNCSLTLHQYLNYLRFSEENLILFLVKKKILFGNADTFFSKSEPYTWKSKKFAEFKPGDMIISQGTSFISTYVSSMVFPARSYSHISFVVEQDKKLMTYDFFPSGVRILPLEQWLKDPGSRMAVYRFKDERLAQRVVSRSVHAIQEFQKNHKTIFPYFYNDQSLDLTSEIPNGSLFCSGLISWAFAKETNGKIILPWKKSKFYFLDNADVLLRLGVNKQEVFHPSDLEADPNVDLVAESRMFNYIKDSHVKESIFDLLAIQLSNKSYAYKYSWKTLFKTYFIKLKTYCCDNNQSIFINYIPATALESIVEISNTLDYYRNSLDEKLEQLKLSDQVLSSSQYNEIIKKISP
jgi:hypothetical protein